MVVVRFLVLGSRLKGGKPWLKVLGSYSVYSSSSIAVGLDVGAVMGVVEGVATLYSGGRPRPLQTSAIRTITMP